MPSAARGWFGRSSLVLCVALGLLVVSCGMLAGGAFAAGDANETVCPAVTEASSGFSAFMPDCRAFEQVTPVFKDAEEPDPVDFSGDGLDVLAESLGAFAGTESDSEAHGSVYEFSRSSSGWGVSAISPPASAFPAQHLVAASPELGSTLWIARSPSESIAAQNLYVREDDGAMVKLGAMLPPSTTGGPASGEFEGFLYRKQVVYRDASTDLSHVVFSIEEVDGEGLGWPGDTTRGKDSIYEYSGRGEAQPELVGVNNEDHLISICSTYLGSTSSSDLYNAESVDGQTVFFTAQDRSECGAVEGPEVPELYARVGGFETVAISEPSPQQCAACQTSTKAAGEFAGASEDGSKVFFLTEQELLPGAAGMNLYEYDFDAPPAAHVVLASHAAAATPADVLGVARVSEDGSHVYFVAEGRLGKGPRGGKNGPCIAELGAGEQAEEAVAEEQERSGEPVTHGARCRPTDGGDNLYVFERDAAHPGGQVSFIATLSMSDSSDWSELDGRRLVGATPDGRFFVFRSAAHLTVGDVSSSPQLFEYDATSGELVRVSRGSNGDEAQGTVSANANAAEIPPQVYAIETGPALPEANLVVSGNGSTVLFGDAGVLTGEAGESAGSAYEYRSSVASGGTISQGNVYLISDGAGVAGEGVPGVYGLDESGQDAFFVTAGPLVKGDTDQQFDTYDAREDGGFLGADSPAGCVAEACGGSLYEPPSFTAPEGTALPSGPAAPTSVPVGSAPTVVGKPKPVVTGRGVLLGRALRACLRVHGRGRRVACEALALRRYGPHRKAKRTGGRAK
jgi:hypothetical protein